MLAENITLILSFMERRNTFKKKTKRAREWQGLQSRKAQSRIKPRNDQFLRITFAVGFLPWGHVTELPVHGGIHQQENN